MSDGQTLRIEHDHEPVSRCVVMRGNTWAALKLIAKSIRDHRGVDCSAAEIANIAIEAGLDAIRKELAKAEKGPA